jgi:ABC-type branched-subunit amino acid transport system ATPase component
LSETLAIVDLTKHFGGLSAVSQVSFQAQTGQITGLIGPNGAGKTTVFNMISGLIRPSSGKIFFKDHELTGKPPHMICRLGLARTFQNLQLFKNMTVLENAMVGLHSRTRAGILESGLSWPTVRREETQIRERALQCLLTLGLAEAANQIAGTLPFGSQRLLEIARALASAPKMVLLDEPECGLNMREVEELRRTIFSIRDSGISVLLVEHNMRLVMRTADHIIVLDHGQKISEGPPAIVQNDSRVREAYLGKKVER